MKDLFNLISEIKGQQTAEIVYVADCGIPKKVGLGNVTKKVALTCDIYGDKDYADLVREKIAEKGGDPTSFQKETLRWGQWELANKVITNKGERYLRYYCKDGNVPQVEYFVNGVSATSQQIADIKAYLDSKDTSSKKQGACGLTKKEEIMPRNVKFSNVLCLKVNGETYTKQTSQVA